MNYPLLNKITVVIFTYNRHQYLKKTILFWLKTKVKILILDGSKKKFKDSCINSNNVNYINNTNGLFARLLSSSNFIKTEFLILSSDDEFFLPSALESCIKFLQKEPTYTNCGGRAIGFISKRKKILGLKQYPRLKNFSLVNKNPNLRVLSHFSNYVPAHFYSVMRLSKWKIISKFVFSNNYNFLGSHELQVEFLSAISGKSKILPELMWLRNKENPPIKNFEIMKMDLRTWWSNDKYKVDKKDFIKIMSEASNELLNKPNSNTFDETIIQSFESYMNTLIKETFIVKVRKLMPYKIKLYKKKFFDYLEKFNRNKYKSLLEEAAILQNEGVIVNQRDIFQVISYL